MNWNLKYIYFYASKNEGSLKGGTIFWEMSVKKQAIPIETMGPSPSYPYITDTNELILTYTIEQKYKNG